METAGTDVSAPSAELELRLLGTLAVRRRGVEVTLPASRKVRALLAYLALALRPVARTRLCDLLWDDPDDPRGELRWCLSKLRRVLDTPDRTRVLASADTVALDLDGAYVDALHVSRASVAGDVSPDREPVASLEALFGGELLAGFELDRHPEFTSWLIAERRRFRGHQVALLERITSAANGEAALPWLELWLQLAPFDVEVHERLLRTLADLGRHAEGEAHVAAAARRFTADGLDPQPLRAAWRRARSQVLARGASSSGLPAVSDGAATSPAGEVLPGDATQRARRASVLVMPFADVTGERGGAADGLSHDVVTRLAKLRSLFVIAQGTALALRERGVAPEEAARALGVDYVVSATVRRRTDRLSVAVELSETQGARLAWAETFELAESDALALLDEIGDRIVASVAAEIESVERNRAVLKPPSSLDAWEALHRGLWHVYRFAREDNERARGFFEQAVRLDPTFARAHAALSFTHWQSAFQGWGRAESETEAAYAAASQALLADDRDPAAHYAMGRALWLRGEQQPSVIELEHAVDLSPNFALGHYALAFVRSQAGDARAAIDSAELSRRLSPFDPLLFAMLGARAMAHVRLGQFDQAAEWAVKAAARPNAHVHILGIAALSLALADSLDAARVQLAAVRKVAPGYRLADYFRAFRFDETGRALFTTAADRLGLPR